MSSLKRVNLNDYSNQRTLSVPQKYKSVKKMSYTKMLKKRDQSPYNNISNVIKDGRKLEDKSFQEQKKQL